jgi:hypothetical protein
MLIWQGKVINITLIRYAGDLKWSCAEIFDREWQDWKSQIPQREDEPRLSCAELFDHSWADWMAQRDKKLDKEAKKKAATTF